MHNIFFRIYMGIIVAIVATALLVSISVYFVSKIRISEHLHHHYSGTFSLISEGVARHTGSEREQWIAAIERLSGLNFSIHNFSDQRLSKAQLGKLLNNKFTFSVSRSLVESNALILLPENQQYLEVNIDDYGTSLIRISAFLMLNELGRHKNDARLEALNHLRDIFHYPIELLAIEDLDLDATNIRTIKKGDVAVVLNISGANTPTMLAFAPIGNSRFVLKLGEIPLFDWFPIPILISFTLLMLMLIALIIFYLVKPLENRLADVDRRIVKIAQEHEFEDITPNKQDAIEKLSVTVDAMAARIHKLIEAQTDMVRAVSHELRAPITRVRFQIEALESQVVTPEKINRIEKNLDELEVLIDEVLTFLKLKSDKPHLNVEYLDATEFISQSININQLPNNQYSFNKIIEVSELTGDTKYLYRAIGNLVTNACKFAKNNIEVGVKLEGTHYIIWVGDDGEGIPFEHRTDVFEPFKRIDASRSRTSGGYGLGLSIVKQIAIWHHGSVNISDSPLGGAQISFSWPRYGREHDQK